jgi:hypothetical protein
MIWTHKGHGSEQQRRRLRLLNAALALLHATSAALIVALATEKWTVYLTVPQIRWEPREPGVACDDTVCSIRTTHVQAFAVHIETIVAVFHSFAVLSHLYAAIDYKRCYYNKLLRGRVPHRWIEYGVSAPPMFTCILLLCGTTDVWTHLACFALVALTQAMGHAADIAPQHFHFFFACGCLMQLVIWPPVYQPLYDILGAAAEQPPTFVYYIVWSLLLLFCSFAIVNYRFRGRPIRAEYWYMALSLTAKSALAWQIFYGALQRETQGIVQEV